MQLQHKIMLGVVAAAFGFGGVVGQAVTNPEPEYIVRTETKTVEVKGDDVVTNEIPKSCATALYYAETIANESDAIYDVGTRQYRVLSEARKVVAMGTDSSKVNNDQRQLTSSLNGSLSRLQEANYKFELAEEECRDQS